MADEISAGQIVKDLTAELEKKPEVLVFVLFGSQARETIYTATEDSDIDTHVIVQDNQREEFEKELPEIVRKLGPVIFSYHNQWAGFSTVFANLQRLEIPVKKFSEMATAFDRPKQQPVKVLIDRTNGELQFLLDKRPEKIDFGPKFAEKISDFWYMAIVAAQYFKKGEIYNARRAAVF